MCGRARWRSQLPEAYDAGVYFIGRIRTPFKIARRLPEEHRLNPTPSAGSNSIRAMPPGSRTSASTATSILLYWMDQARRDLIQQVPAHLGHPRGTFALRSPVRPNPIALAAVELVGIDGATLTRAQRRLHRRHAAPRHQALFRLDRQLSRCQAAVKRQTSPTGIRAHGSRADIPRAVRPIVRAHGHTIRKAQQVRQARRQLLACRPASRCPSSRAATSI